MTIIDDDYAECDKEGNTERWFDKDGRPHNPNGPAVHDGKNEIYYWHGLLHNIKGPAIVRGERYSWYVNNIRIQSWEQFSRESGIPIQEVFKMALVSSHPPGISKPLTILQ